MDNLAVNKFIGNIGSIFLVGEKSINMLWFENEIITDKILLKN